METDPGSTMGFSQAGFNTQYSDAENDPMVSLKITTLPSQGTLKLNGTNVTTNQVIPAAQLDNLTYETVNAVYNTNFNFTANDGTSDSNVGVESLVIDFQGQQN
jgi:large repetitive protein